MSAANPLDVSVRVNATQKQGCILASKIARAKELVDRVRGFMERAMAKGILINLTAKQVVRLAPAINITHDDWERGLDRLIDFLAAEALA